MSCLLYSRSRTSNRSFSDERGCSVSWVRQLNRFLPSSCTFLCVLYVFSARHVFYIYYILWERIIFANTGSLFWLEDSGFIGSSWELDDEIWTDSSKASQKCRVQSLFPLVEETLDCFSSDWSKDFGEEELENLSVIRIFPFVKNLVHLF